MNTYLTTTSGNTFDFGSPCFNLHDIVHALGNIQRFGGHAIAPWSVRQHSIACCYYAPDEWKLEALMHDACEAYLCDVPTPLKLLLPDYRALEGRVDRAMRAEYSLPSEMSAEVRRVDQALFVAEAYEFHPKLWVELGRPTVDHLAWKAIQRAKTSDSVDAFIALWHRYLLAPDNGSAA